MKNENKKKKKNEKGGVQVENSKRMSWIQWGLLELKACKRWLDKGKKPQKAIQSLKSSNQSVEVESKVLFGRIKIVGRVFLLKEDSGSQI